MKGNTIVLLINTCTCDERLANYMATSLVNRFVKSAMRHEAHVSKEAINVYGWRCSTKHNPEPLPADPSDRTRSVVANVVCSHHFLQYDLAYVLSGWLTAETLA